MNTSATCPRCYNRLVPGTASDTQLKCETCEGMFVCSSTALQEVLKASTELRDAAADEGGTYSIPLICPGCRREMRKIQLNETILDSCDACEGIWLDQDEELSLPTMSPAPAAGEEPADLISLIHRNLLYGLSLPERLVRGTVGLAAGAASELSGFLVPQAFQNSKTYRIVVGDSLRFLTEDFAGVASKSPETAKQEQFLARKTVGNFVDLAGMATLHVSPLWLMTIVSDVAYGTKGYLQELSEELKRQGIIEESSTIHRVDDVLEAIRNASGQASSLFDTPPLSVDELTKTLEETRSALSAADYRAVLPESELRDYWNEMRAIASAENVSLLSVSGAMTMNTLDKLKAVSQGTLTGIEVAGGLLNRHVIGHYVDSLRKLQTIGFYETVRESYQPYVEALWRNFAAERETWTEEILSGRMFGKAFRVMTGWWSAGDDNLPAPSSSGIQPSSCPEDSLQTGGDSLE